MMPWPWFRFRRACRRLDASSTGPAPMRRNILFVLLFVPLAANAQLGGLMKKAQQKMADKAAEKAADKAADAGLGAQPKFDEVLIELNEARLTAAIKGLARERDLRSNGDLAGKLKAAAALDSSSRAAMDRTRDARDRWDDSRSRITSCIDKVLDERSKGHDALVRQKMAQYMLDAQAQATAGKASALPQKMSAIQTEMLQAFAKGDTILAVRKQGELFKLFGIDLAADSAAGRAKCGSIPAKPADVARADKLTEESVAAATAARELEQRAGEEAAKAAGMTLPQFALARERLEMWVQTHGKGSYSAAERAAIKAHLDEFTPLVKA